MNLAFALLDDAVVRDRGDELLLADPPCSFALLLEESAAVGGVLLAVGAGDGSAVTVAGDDDLRVVTAALAAARVGAVLAPDAEVRFGGEQVGLHWPGGNELDWAGVLRAGRTDPAYARERAPEAAYDATRTVGEMVEQARALDTPLSAAALRSLLVPADPSPPPA